MKVSDVLMKCDSCGGIIWPRQHFGFLVHPDRVERWHTTCRTTGEVSAARADSTRKAA